MRLGLWESHSRRDHCPQFEADHCDHVGKFGGSSPSPLNHPLCTVYLYHWQLNSPRELCYHHQFDSWCIVLRFEILTSFTPPNIPLCHCDQIAQPWSPLTIKLFSRGCLICPCEQLKIQIELEGVILEQALALFGAFSVQ